MKDISLIKNGDPIAFKQVYDEYHVKVFRYFYKRTQVHETARELTQITFIKLWQYRSSLSTAFSLDTQLFRMANSALVDHFRKEARGRNIFLHTEDIQEIALSPAEQSAHAALESADYFKEAIKQLPPVRKKIFTLKMVHGYSNRDIAGELCISVKTVEDHLSKGIRHLRTIAGIAIPLFLLN